MNPILELPELAEPPEVDPTAEAAVENDIWLSLVEDGVDIMTAELLAIVEIVEGFKPQHWPSKFVPSKVQSIPVFRRFTTFLAPSSSKRSTAKRNSGRSGAN